MSKFNTLVNYLVRYVLQLLLGRDGMGWGKWWAADYCEGGFREYWGKEWMKEQDGLL